MSVGNACLDWIGVAMAMDRWYSTECRKRNEDGEISCLLTVTALGAQRGSSQEVARMNEMKHALLIIVLYCHGRKLIFS